VNILGIIISTNSTAALLKDGKIVACMSEERLSRKKNTNDYPKHAIEYCLKEAGITAREIDQVALAGYTFNSDYWSVDHDTNFSVKEKIREQYDYWYPKLYEKKAIAFLNVFKDKVLPDRDKLVKEAGKEDIRIYLIKKHLNIPDEKIKIYNHHNCHSYYAYYGSPYRDNDTLIFIAEGFGDDANASISEFVNDELKFHYRTDDCSIGRLYRYMTLLLGMKSNEHEFKVMGLAPYAKELYYQDALDIFKTYMYVDGIEFKYHKRPKDLFFEYKKALEHIRFDNIAGALQKYIEILLTEWVENACTKFNKNKIVFSGGVGMNIKAMMEISKLQAIKDMFVCPTGSDESLAIGACYHAYKKLDKLNDISMINNAYLGNDISGEMAKDYIIKNKIDKKYKIVFDIKNRDVAELLSDGYVIARASGRMEFGARALGNRSILADPRDYSIVRIINDKIKKRDFWMPFAPVLLKERVSDYLINPKNIDAPYMTIGFETTELGKKELIAGLHPSDFTARPQIVSEEQNPAYYHIIKEFEKMTGVGGLVNTSFNLHGEPIVSTCKDAMHVFENSGIDVLILGNHAVFKS